MRNDVLRGQPRELLFNWLSERIGLEWSDNFTAIGRFKDGKLVGVVGFTGFNGASCAMHMAGDEPRWASATLIRESFRYAFDVIGCQVVFAIVPSGNARALAIDLKLGFEEVANISGAHPDGSLHILVMRRENCRWLR